MIDPINDESNQSEDAQRPPQRPRDPRVPVNFTVEIEGRTVSGEPFCQPAEAVLISRAGLTLISDVVVQLGTPIRVTPTVGKPLDAEVNGVWISKDDKRQRIGVKLLDPNGWFAE